MKRPLVVITAGFVLGEVLALCLQEAVYRICFWFAGVLFLTVLAARRFLSRSVIYRTLLLIFVFVFGGMTAGSFSGARCRDQMEQEEKRIIQAGFGDVVQLVGQVVDVREKSEKLEIIVNQVKVERECEILLTRITSGGCHFNTRCSFLEPQVIWKAGKRSFFLGNR
ncbi:MAG: hypothetical protein ACLT4E_02475 [Clostridium sp.]